MGADPTDDFLKKPLREQLDILVETWTKGSMRDEAPGVPQALMMRILVESSQRLEGLTGWLVRLTLVLAVLTGVLAYDVVQRLIGN